MAKKELYEIYEENKGAVVRVMRTKKSPGLKKGKLDWVHRPISVGSGFVLKVKDQYFVFTAKHVVDELKKEESLFIEATETKSGERKWLKALPVKKGTSYDLALLVIKNEGYELSNAKIAELALRKRHKKIGVEVYWISYPAFEFVSPIVMQKGIIAGFLSHKDGFYYIIDGMTNKGSSGGPVFTLEGKVIGIISGSLISPHNYRVGILDVRGNLVEDICPSSGLGVVVPMNYLKNLLEEKEGKKEKIVRKK